MPTQQVGEFSIDYLSWPEIERKLLESEEHEILDLTKNSDVTSGKYEGGFKIWEGAWDLGEYICKLPNSTINSSNVIEVGCGAGIPGIITLLLGAKEVHFQDMANILANKERNNFPGEHRIVAGDWATVSEQFGERKFDIVLAAETIYNENYYERLHLLFDSLLTQNGVILMAAKFYYFGLSGSAPKWMEYVESKGCFRAQIVWKSSSSVPRVIMKHERIH